MTTTDLVMVLTTMSEDLVGSWLFKAKRSCPLLVDRCTASLCPTRVHRRVAVLLINIGKSLRTVDVGGHGPVLNGDMGFILFPTESCRSHTCYQQGHSIKTVVILQKKFNLAFWAHLSLLTVLLELRKGVKLCQND